jgi:hypothetical protein
VSNTRIIPPRVAFTDPRTGMISRAWYLFLLNLFNQAGGSSGVTLEDVQLLEAIDADVVPPNPADVLSYEPEPIFTLPDAEYEFSDDSRAFLTQLIQDAMLLGYEPEQAAAQAQPVAVITVGASPYSYTAMMPGSVIVEGGGVSALEFSRDGSTYYSTGSYYGMFALEKGDILRATYVSAPNMTFVPRSQ